MSSFPLLMSQFRLLSGYQTETVHQNSGALLQIVLFTGELYASADTDRWEIKWQENGDWRLTQSDLLLPISHEGSNTAGGEHTHISSACQTSQIYFVCVCEGRKRTINEFYRVYMRKSQCGSNVNRRSLRAMEHESLASMYFHNEDLKPEIQPSTIYSTIC